MRRLAFALVLPAFFGSLANGCEGDVSTRRGDDPTGEAGESGNSGLGGSGAQGGDGGRAGSPTTGGVGGSGMSGGSAGDPGDGGESGEGAGGEGGRGTAGEGGDPSGVGGGGAGTGGASGAGASGASGAGAGGAGAGGLGGAGAGGGGAGGRTGADLSLRMGHSDNFVIGYTAGLFVEVWNEGDQATPGPITIVDTLPPELEFVSASGLAFTCNNVGREVRCTRPTGLPAMVTLSGIQIVARATTAMGSPFTNRAVVSAPGDVNPSNDQAEDAVPVASYPPVDLGITKSHTGNFSVGQAGTFTLIVRNVGAYATTEPITVTDVLPPELAFVSVSAPSWTCDRVQQTVSCVYVGSVAVGQIPPPILVTVNPTTAVGSPFSNTATVSTTGGTRPMNDSSTDTVVVN